ncbi:MAG: SpoIIE family protein phosphatase [Bacteroidetes bacterium]|nr:SpoIIE family protein phosphatase [Bacteroidota bacterium]
MKQENINKSSALEEENKRLRNAIAELSIINDIATTINSTQPVEQIVDIIVKKCVKHLNVEQGAIMLLDESDKEKPLHTMIREQQSSLDLLPYRFDTQLTGWMLKNQEPLLVNNLKEDERFKDLVDKTTPFESFLSVPLRVKNKMQGILTVFNKRSNEKFSSNDQKLLSIIASQSSQIIENARLLEEERNLQVLQEEMRVAKQTQINLLPKEFPVINGYQIAARTIPAKEVGGDSYDLIQIDDKHFAFCLGDVSGKGMPAAMLMSNLQATLRSFTKTGNLCKDIIANSNDLLYNSTEPSKFATLFYGILNPESNEIVFCNAGHNNPFLFSADGNVKELKTGGLILGCLPGSEYEEEKVSINRNDIIVIFSDGISEAMNENEEEYGEERLKEFISNHLDESPDKIIENILSDVRMFVGKAPQWDDMTLLIIKREEQ